MAIEAAGATPEDFAVVHWVESTHTPSHLERFAEITREVAKIGVHQVLLSGDKGLEMATDRSGSLQEFGFDSSIQVVSLPTERQTGQNAEAHSDFDPSYALWQYMNDPVVVHARRNIISQTLQGIKQDGLQVSHVIPEMYPVGMCILGAEVEYLHDTAKSMFPNALVTPLARDIPAIMLGSPFNDPYDQVARMRRYADALFVRGDPGVLEQYYQQYGMDEEVRAKFRNIGHFIGHATPEPDTSIPDEQKRVLVSAGGSSSQAPREQNQYYQFYRGIIEAKAESSVAERDWTVCIPDDFPAELRTELAELAGRVGGIELRGNMPVADHRQAIVDSALFVTVSGYSSMLAGLQSRAPTVVVPAQIQTNGVQQDDIDRSQRYHNQGLVTQITLEELADSRRVSERISFRATAGPAPLDSIPSMDGARNIAAYIQSDIFDMQETS